MCIVTTTWPLFVYNRFRHTDWCKNNFFLANHIRNHERTCCGYGFVLQYVVQAFKIMCKGITCIRRCCCLFLFIISSRAVSWHGSLFQCVWWRKKRSKLNFTTNYFIIVLPLSACLPCFNFGEDSASTRPIASHHQWLCSSIFMYFTFLLFCFSFFAFSTYKATPIVSFASEFYARQDLYKSL